MIKTIIISLVFIVPIFSITKLTTSNCPQNINFTAYNTSLDTSNSNLAESLYSTIFAIGSNTPLQNKINAGDFTGIIQQAQSKQFLMPFILICAGFFLIFAMSLCCCLFDRRCPPCESWKRNYVKDPYSKCEQRCLIFILLLFSISILVTTIIGISSFSAIVTDMKMVKCGFYYSLDISLNGDIDNKWAGFSQIQSKLTNVTQLISSTVSSINSNLLGNQWIKKGLQTIKNMNIQLWYNNKDSKILTPDPTATTNALNLGLDIPTIVPLFIQSGLGPNGTANTMITDLDAGFQITQKLSNQAQATYQSALQLSNSASHIINNTNINLQSISIASSYLANIGTSISNFVTSYINFSISPGILFIQAIYGIILLSTMLSILGIIFTYLFKLFTCKKLVNSGWVLFGLLYFGIIMVLFIFLSFGGLSYSFCKYFKSIIDSNNGYITFTQASKTSNFNKFFLYLDVCFFGDGNILKKFQISKQIDSISNLFINTQTFINMQQAANSQFIDANVAPAKIFAWMNTMQKYGDGIYIDAVNSSLQSNPYNALANMNKYTNVAAAAPVNTTCANDYWVFDIANCTYSSTESIYIPTSDANYAQYIPPTGTFCISLNTGVSALATSKWSTSNIIQRYLAVRSCKAGSVNAFNKIIQYSQSLTNYRDSRIDLYKSLYDQLNSILAVINTYNTNTTTFTGKLSNFYSANSGLGNAVTSQVNGLTVSSNCTIIADSIRFFYNMYCINLLNRTVKIGICCIILLFFMLGGVIMGSIFGIRFSNLQKIKMVLGNQNESEIFKNDQLQKSQETMSQASDSEKQ